MKAKDKEKTKGLLNQMIKELDFDKIDINRGLTITITVKEGDLVADAYNETPYRMFGRVV